MSLKRFGRLGWVFLGVVLFPSNIAAQEPLPSSPERLVLIEVEDLRTNPERGLLIDSFYFFAHNGKFDMFNYGQAAPEGLTWFANEGFVDELFSQIVEESPDAYAFMQVDSEVPYWRASNHFSTVSTADWVIPGETNYVTVLGRVYPSDDAFFGNEDPMRYQLFDDDGNFLGPLVIDIYGTDILDAGTRLNEEQDLLGLDRNLFDERGQEPWVRTENASVRPHPGFNGSIRNPDSEPVRVLAPGNEYCPATSSACYLYDHEALDFSRPGFPLARIRLSLQGDIHGGYSGVYFSPERAGEGFVIHAIGNKPRQVVIYWYTYSADGSGKQLWLIGQGLQPTESFQDWRLDFFSATGGKLTSLENPSNVELHPWGTGSLGIAGNSDDPACQQLVLFDIQPMDPSTVLDLPTMPTTRYELVRLGSQLTGMEGVCGDDAYVNLLPVP